MKQHVFNKRGLETKTRWNDKIIVLLFSLFTQTAIREPLKLRQWLLLLYTSQDCDVAFYLFVTLYMEIYFIPLVDCPPVMQLNVGLFPFVFWVLDAEYFV